MLQHLSKSNQMIRGHHSDSTRSERANLVAHGGRVFALKELGLCLGLDLVGLEGSVDLKVAQPAHSTIHTNKNN